MSVNKGHGGARRGAGRKKIQAVAPTSLSEIDLKSALAAPPPDEIEPSAQRHARLALESLVKRLTFGKSDAARVSAANGILDRGYGKPAVDIGGDAMLPFQSVPVAPTSSSEIRILARGYANLAIEVLRRITEFGESESASVTAAKSLWDRGLGTVAQARMPDEFNARPMGKKEEATAAAKLAGTGRFATPSAPPRSPKIMQ